MELEPSLDDEEVLSCEQEGEDDELGEEPDK
jgi:hypothetical protein